MPKRKRKETKEIAREDRKVIQFQSERIVGDSPDTARPDMQIMLVLHGTASLFHQDTEEALSSGDLIAVRPGLRYCFKGAHALQVVRCSFNPRVLRMRVGNALDPKALFILSSSTSVSRYELPTDRFRTIAAMLSAATSGGDMGNIGRTLLLLETVVEYGRTAIPKIHPAVFQAIQDFDRNVVREWTLSELAGELDLDPSYVARLFKSGVGVPPLAYLALLRAEEAASLLALTKIACSTVGERVGWTDSNYFSRRFRQHFGESPTAFRDRALLNSN